MVRDYLHRFNLICVDSLRIYTLLTSNRENITNFLIAYPSKDDHYLTNNDIEIEEVLINITLEEFKI